MKINKPLPKIFEEKSLFFLKKKLHENKSPGTRDTRMVEYEKEKTQEQKNGRTQEHENENERAGQRENTRTTAQRKREH